jgi:hypothetical protein
MKYSKIYIISTVFLLALNLSSCKKFLDINKDPNNPTADVATAELVLPAALKNTASIYNNPTNGNSNFAFAGLWLGHMAYSGNFSVTTELTTYNITNNFGPNIWAACYDNNADYDFIEKKGIATKNNFYAGVGKLMKAYNYQTLVDIYNNVPYSEALLGTANATPKYDKGQEVYDNLLKDVDAAILLLQTTNNASTKGDVMFAGDVDAWLALANTVRLRMLLRQSERTDRASYITTNAANQLAGYVGSDVEINPGYLNSTGKQNPFWENSFTLAGTYNEDFYRAGASTVDFMKAHNDPRLAMVYNPASSTGEFTGNLFGDQGLVNSKTSTFGPGILKSFSQPSILMTAAESYFLQAEAVLKNYITGDAKALYESGVASSFATLGLSATEAGDYVAQAGDNEVNWDACADDMERLALIIRQKWAALAMINELEVYNDYRRLKLPTGVHISTASGSTGAIPLRLLYPQRELSVNGANVAAQGTVTPTSPVWWIK